MNKKLFLFIPVLAIIFAFAANRPADNSNDEINFFKGTWNEALKKSADENKPIFLDVSTSWCMWCKILKHKTFTDPDVAKYYNANFINVEIDAEVGEGVLIAQQYQVSSYPSLFVINKNQKIILAQNGYIGADSFIEFGKSAIAKSN